VTPWVALALSRNGNVCFSRHISYAIPGGFSLPSIHGRLQLSLYHTTAPRTWGLYAAWLVLCCLVFSNPLRLLARYALHNDNASHILLIPLIVAWLIHTDCQRIVPAPLDLSAASLFALPAALLSATAMYKSFAGTSVSLSLLILALVLLLSAGFVALFGRASAKSVWFSLAFLLFAIPFPEPLLNRIIYLLQSGSAAVAEIIFDWSDVPVLREGFVFHLPKMSIEVASECSGIRSSIALLILALLVAHFAFSRFWKKILFVAAGLLMMIVKNGVRIATLTLLANYVDPGFLYGRLHKEGGVVFFLIGLVLLVPVYSLLRRGEESLPPPRPQASTP
jgi:exosortase